MYPLLFPYGNDGYTLKIPLINLKPSKKSGKITQVEMTGKLIFYIISNLKLI